MVAAERMEYDGVSCRPTDIAPPTKAASRWLSFRCGIDSGHDVVQHVLGRGLWRGIGLCDRLVRPFGLGGVYHRVGVLHRLHSPRPLVRPVFIVGSPRSGTTILGTILGCQGDVLFLNEARPIWHRAVPEINESRFHWVGGEPWGRIHLTEADDNEASRKSLEFDFGRLLTWSRKERLVEKLPLNLFRVPWLRAMWGDAKFVQIMRDPFSTTASKAQSWPSIDEKQFPGIAIRRRMFLELFPEHEELLASIRSPYEWYLFEWRIDTEMGERLLGDDRRDFLFVRLEDAQSQPEPFFAKWCDFCGLRVTDRLRRAYRTKLNRRVRMAKPSLDKQRCLELLGESAGRWGYSV